MSSSAAPRQRLREYFLEIKLTARKHIVVEGRTDERFVKAWLRDIDAQSNVVVTSVENLEVPVVDVVAIGLNEGNRSRVIVVAARASAEAVNLRCIADTDCGKHVEEHNYETLLWTDYPAIESYAVDEATLDKANLLSFGERLPSADQLIGPLAFALGELYAVRCQNEDLPKPNYKAGLPGQSASLAEFDVKAAVQVSLRKKVGSYPRPDDPDPRKFSYGHDIGELLLAAFGNALKNQAGFRTVEAVEGALRSAIQAAGSYVHEPLFVHLREWIAA